MAPTILSTLPQIDFREISLAYVALMLANFFFFILGTCFVFGRIFKLANGDKILAGTLSAWKPGLKEICCFIALINCWMLGFTYAISLILDLAVPAKIHDNAFMIYVTGAAGTISVATICVLKIFFPKTLPKFSAEKIDVPAEKNSVVPAEKSDVVPAKNLRFLNWLTPNFGENIWTFLGALLVLLVITSAISRLVPLCVPQLEDSWSQNQALVENLSELRGSAAVFFVAAISTILFAPICEEIVFRCGIYRLFKGKIGAVPAAILTGICFASLHDTAVGALPLFALSCFLSFSYERSGTIFVPMILHGIFNSNSLLQILLMPENLNF